jgi:hypothetical protein
MDQSKLIAAALRRMQSLKLDECFDANNVESVPTDDQLEVFKDISKVNHRYCRGGNQCKPFQSLVKLADGSLKQLGKIKEGDEVLTWDVSLNKLSTAKVEAVWDNDARDVYRYILENGKYTDSTENHEMLQSTGEKLPISKCNYLLDSDGNQIRIVNRWLVSHEKVYDISIDHPDHNYICDGLITGNSGKSQVLRREVAWMFERKHPYFIPPADWAEDEPWQILLIGKTRRMLEDSLWSGIKKFLKPGTYKEVKVGPYLEKIEHKENGNTIILLSHDNPSVAVERMQSYTAHYIGLDEMPTSYKVIEELHRRGQAKAAPFLASFTPKSQNIQIKKLVDAITFPYGKVYKLRSLDNPVMSTKKKKDLLESVKSYSESYQRTILEGDWMIGERSVYQFNPEVTIDAPPQTYHKGWRHIESSDPAVSSKFGFTLWAEDPATGLWYCIRDEYVEGLYVPEKIFQHVQELTRGYNIVKRVCDPHETWYINTARSHGVHYQTPYDKNSRKNELIKGLQSAMISEIRIAPWCERLIEELSNCQFREDSDKIVNSSSYHLLDTAQYFVDLKPAHDPELAPKSWEVELREANQKRKEKKASLAKQRINTGRKGRTIAQWQRRRSSL